MGAPVRPFRGNVRRAADHPLHVRRCVAVPVPRLRQSVEPFQATARMGWFLFPAPQTRLLLFVLEGDVHPHPVADHFPVFHRYILLHHFTDAEILDGLCSSFYGKLCCIFPRLRAGPPTSFTTYTLITASLCFILFLRVYSC